MQTDDTPAEAAGVQLSERVELLKAGISFPGETSEEAACRLRRQFDLVTESELAALAGVDLRTLREWRAKAEDPEHIKLGRNVLYPRQAVADWLQRRGEHLGTMWPRTAGPAPARSRQTARSGRAT